MNYDNDPDFNAARTPEESTQEFADARAAMYDAANKDFSIGTIGGIFISIAVGFAYLLVW